jgi:hypothetical protein
MGENSKNRPRHFLDSSTHRSNRAGWESGVAERRGLTPRFAKREKCPDFRLENIPYAQKIGFARQRSIPPQRQKSALDRG